MKIDNKGWGLTTMLLMVAVIFIALLTATFFSIRLNAMLGKQNNESEEKVQKAVNETYYIGKLNEMTIAVNNYVNDNGVILSKDKLRINLTTLVNSNYINEIYDSLSNNVCSGYSYVYLNNDNIKQVNSYLKCDNYTSIGYGE